MLAVRNVRAVWNGDFRTIAANKTAQPNIVTAIASSDFYALNTLIGTRLAEYLPDHVGLDRFKNNYTQVRPQGPFSPLPS